MDKKFWLEVWEKGQIFFNQNKPHPFLLKYAKAWKPNSHVFVPLCGKSIDMKWLLDNGFNIIGVELSELAVNDFFKENNISFKKVTQPSFTIYEFNGSKIYLGDFFDLNLEHLKQCRYLYDRASLIALPPEIRHKYYEHLDRILSNVEGLVILFQRLNAPDPTLGPPFNVMEEEVIKNLPNFTIEKIEERFDKVFVERDQKEMDVVIKAFDLKKV